MSPSVEILPIAVPERGETVEVAPGIHWLRMPLPFALDHINLWLLEDEDGWTAVDCGVANDEIRDLWRRILTPRVARKPLRRMVCTHSHPDHMGLAGWLASEYGAELWTTRGEWMAGRLFSHGGHIDKDLYGAHYRAAGCSEEDVDASLAHVGSAEALYDPVPERCWRLKDGDHIRMAGRDWHVMVALGHSVEHACLYCPDLELMIGGDQFLAKITPALLAYPSEPNSSPLRDFLDSNKRFLGLSGEVRILPSHKWPFRGLRTRIDEYESHHAARLETTMAVCERPASCVEIARKLFEPRPIDGRIMFFAVGETLAHVRYLQEDGLIGSETAADGIIRYFQT